MRRLTALLALFFVLCGAARGADAIETCPKVSSSNLWWFSPGAIYYSVVQKGDMYWGRTADVLAGAAPEKLPEAFSYAFWTDKTTIAAIVRRKEVWRFNAKTGALDISNLLQTAFPDESITEYADLRDGARLLLLMSKDRSAGAAVIHPGTLSITRADYIDDALPAGGAINRDVWVDGTGREPPLYRTIYSLKSAPDRIFVSTEFWDGDAWTDVAAYSGKAQFIPRATLNERGAERLIFPLRDKDGFWTVAAHDSDVKETNLLLEGLGRDIVGIAYSDDLVPTPLWARVVSADSAKRFDYISMSDDGRRILDALTDLEGRDAWVLSARGASAFVEIAEAEGARRIVMVQDGVQKTTLYRCSGPEPSTAD